MVALMAMPGVKAKDWSWLEFMLLGWLVGLSEDGKWQATKWETTLCDFRVGEGDGHEQGTLNRFLPRCRCWYWPSRTQRPISRWRWLVLRGRRRQALLLG